jgi:predicted transposase/invertase (TIGR01784 family)
MTPIQFDDSDDILDICYDNVFKAVFTKETAESMGALRGLLSAFIGREVVSVSVMQNENAVDDVRDRQIRFDISCKFNDGELANIEMSMNPDNFETIRDEFYASRLHTSQGIRGEGNDYSDLKAIYQMSFVDKRSFFNDDAVTHHFEQYDAEHGISLSGKVHIIIVELAKLARLADKPIAGMTEKERWAFFFKYSTNKAKRKEVNEILTIQESITMAATTLLTISRDENERAYLLSKEKYELDHQSHLTQAKRAGLKQGLELGEKKGERKGLKKGVKKGVKQGLEQGLQLGERKKAIKTARAAKREGADIKFIAKITGLSVKEIAGLE